MESKNILSPIIEKKIFINGQPISGQFTNYNLMYSTFYAPENMQLQKGNESIETRLSYTYDSKGNVREVIKDGADKVVYLWSYNYKYPIVEVKNASYSEVRAALGYSDNDINNLASQTNPTVSSIGQQLRNYFAQITSTPVLVTTFAYDPLKGVSEITDPRGAITTYEYDDFGRLTCIKDDENKVIERYEYNYKQ